MQMDYFWKQQDDLPAGIGYLPLHICSIGIFVFLVSEYAPFAKIKEIFGEIAYIFGMKYYLVGYGVLALAVLIMMYVVTGIIDKHK